MYDIQQARHFVASAENIAAERDFYTFKSDRNENPELLEELWAKYENKLGPALDRLIDGTLNGIDWLHTVVPFVASLLVRGPDFDQRVKSRLEHMGEQFIAKHVGLDNANGLRFREIQSLMGTLCLGAWVVAETSEEAPLVINEMGWAACKLQIDPDTKEYTVVYGVPLSKRHLLHIHPRRLGPVLGIYQDDWFPIIGREVLVSGAVQSQADGAFVGAQRFVFGPTKESVTPRQIMVEQGRSRKQTSPLEPWQLPGMPSQYEQTAHELAWHRLACALTHSPKRKVWDFALNIDRLVASKRWMPSLISIPHGNPIIPPCWLRDGDIIWGCLFPVPGITSKPTLSHRTESFRYGNGFPYPWLRPKDEGARDWPGLTLHSWYPFTLVPNLEALHVKLKTWKLKRRDGKMRKPLPKRPARSEVLITKDEGEATFEDNIPSYLKPLMLISIDAPRTAK